MPQSPDGKIKNCINCKLNKPVDEFYAHKTNFDGRKYECKECEKYRRRNLYEKNKERENNRSKEWRNKNKSATSAYNAKYGKENREILNKKQTKYYSDNPDRAKRKRLKSNFGMTLEKYKEMLIEQNSLCDICKRPERSLHVKSGKLQDLCVDHDRILEKQTGEMLVRGLLCKTCNLAIGNLFDNIEYLENAIKYLNKHANKKREKGENK